MMARMPHGNSRKVFLVVAGGNPSAERHFEDTIQRKRTLQEVRGFLPSQEIENLERIYHGSNFIVWGGGPGTNERIAVGEDDAWRRCTHLQQWSHSFRRRDCRQGKEQGARPIFLEGERDWWHVGAYVLHRERREDKCSHREVESPLGLPVPLPPARLLNDQRGGSHEFRAELWRHSLPWEPPLAPKCG